MNKLLIGSIALAMGLGGSAASAADMPLKAPPPAPAPVYSWTGCYVGGDVGQSYGRTDGYSTTAGSVGNSFGGPGVNIALPAGVNMTGPFDMKGPIGGVYAGCNYQFAGTGFVVGVEGDYSFGTATGNAFITPAAFAITGGNPNDLWSLQDPQLGTARLRLGYAVTPNWLWYVTGGGAYARVYTYETISTNAGNASVSDYQTNWRGGWTVGAGTEYALGHGWAVRGEFLYVDFDSFTTFTNINSPPAGALGSNTFTNLSVNLREYIYRVGLSYKFGW
jgi:outer membrane immunogenic protein